MHKDKMVLIVSIKPKLLQLLFVEVLDVQGGECASKKEEGDD